MNLPASEFAKLSQSGIERVAADLVAKRAKTGPPPLQRPRDQKDEEEYHSSVENASTRVDTRVGFSMRGPAVACDRCVYGPKWAAYHSEDCQLPKAWKWDNATENQRED
jgi:hypothetical protein